MEKENIVLRIQPFITFIKNLFKDTTVAYWELLKIMVPTLITIKVLEHVGFIEILAKFLAPFMTLFGLPAEISLVFAATLITNLYAGMAVFIQFAPELTVAQVTVMCTMMLVAHSLPLEQGIVRKAGVRLRYSLLLRFAGAILLGMLLHHFYNWTGLLSQTNTIVWQPEPVDAGLTAWALAQVEMLISIYFIILALMLLLRVLTIIKFVDFFCMLLKPLLRILGIGPNAATVTVIGMLMGLSYGGGLIISETRSESITKHDLLLSVTLMCLCHSLIEDTLLMMMLGAHISGILWARIIFSLCITFLLNLLLSLSQVMNLQEKFLVK